MREATHREHDVDGHEEDRRAAVRAERGDVREAEERVRQRGLDDERDRAGVLARDAAAERALERARVRDEPQADEERERAVERDDERGVRERDARGRPDVEVLAGEPADDRHSDAEH